MTPVLIRVNAKVPTVTYKALHIPPPAALLSCLHPTGLLPVPPTQQACFCLRVFALNSPSAWNVLLSDSHITTPYFFQVLHQMSPYWWSTLTTLFNIASFPHLPQWLSYPTPHSILSPDIPCNLPIYIIVCFPFPPHTHQNVSIMNARISVCVVHCRIPASGTVPGTY